MPTSRELALMLLHGTPVDRVMTLLMAQYPNLPDDAKRARNTAYQVVLQLCKYEDRVRNPDYFAYLETLENHFPEEIDLLRQKSLLRQWGHHRHRYKGMWHGEPELKRLMHDAPNPLRAPFSEFVLPQEVYNMSAMVCRMRAQERQLHTNVSAERVHLDPPTALRIVEQAIAIATEFSGEIDSVRTWYKLVNCMGILSGRRNYEIYCSLDWEPVPGREYQAYVSGLAKEVEEPQEGGWIIPLLCPYPVFDKCMLAIRDFRELSGSASDLSSLSSPLLESMERVFGIHLTHSMKRNLYASVAFERRAVNQFLGGQGAKTYWVNRALGLKMTYIPTVMSYQLINDL